MLHLTTLKNTLAARITAAIQEDRDTGRMLPGTNMALSLALSRWLTADDLHCLARLEKALGEEETNRWLVTVFVATGYYQSSNGEEVQRAA